MVQGVWSEDPKSQLEATAQFRKLLSIGELLRVLEMTCGRVLAGQPHRLSPVCAERNPPIEEVISQGVIPRFVQFLQRNDLPQLQVQKLSRTCWPFSYFVCRCIFRSLCGHARHHSDVR